MLRLKNNAKKRRNAEEDFEKRMYELGKTNYFPGSTIGKLLILLFIITDFIFIRQLVDAYFYESLRLVLASSVMIACVIDISPSVLAGFISIKDKKIMHYFGMFLTFLALISAFFILAMIRLNSADIIYQAQDNQITGFLAEQEIIQTAEGPGYFWMSMLFCLMPVFTSILSFIIGMFENSGNKKKYLKKINRLRKKEKLFDLEANNLELEQELARNLEETNDKYRQLALDDIECQKTITKQIVKLKMAQAVGTPQALTNLMDNAS